MYICGAHPSVGSWTTAHPLRYNEADQTWEIDLMPEAASCEYKFLEGEPSQGLPEAGALQWDEGPNRVLPGPEEFVGRPVIHLQ